MLGKALNGMAFLALAGLIVAILRAFDWDVFAALTWGFDWIWSTLNKVADLWSGNQTFQEVTRKRN